MVDRRHVSVYEDSLRLLAFAIGFGILMRVQTGNFGARDRLLMLAGGVAGSLIYHFVLAPNLSGKLKADDEQRADEEAEKNRQ